MYQINKPTKTSINTNGNGTTFIGQSIEEKMRRIVENKEPIEKAMPIIYTPSNEEVQPAYNIRTDKWEVAIDRKLCTPRQRNKCRQSTRISNK